MTDVLLGGASLVLLVLTVLPLSGNPAWWVRGPEFPRLQLALIAALLLVLQGLLFDFSGLVQTLVFYVTLGIALYQAWWILPYTALWAAEVKRATNSGWTGQVRILTANVLMSNRESEGLLRQVREHVPDVLITLESDEWWEAQFAELLPEYPHTISCPLDNTYGMHLWSRFPLEAVSVDYLVESDVPSFHALIRLPCGTGVRTHVLHPAPPAPQENEGSAERDAELVIVAKSLENNDQPTIVTGDLNDVAWSRTTRLFRQLSGLLDPRIGRGLFNTYNAFHWFARWPLDHIFHSPHFRLQEIQRLEEFGSDHFPLFTVLQYQPALASEQPALEADREDHELADSLVDRVS
ncbi:MAG: endonuclease/exonuclease/phosphatase family protein [Xanthomonadales bacterium]|nr:endonuclease/exonuclease/phosphatase family protein [Xanthomonadales bacterium]